MKLHIALPLAIGTISIAMSLTANAENQSETYFHADNYISGPKIYLGPLLGAGILGNDGGSHLGYGLLAGYRISPYWAAGAFFEHIGRGTINVTTPTGATTTDASLNVYGGEISYFVPPAPGLQAGIRAGLGTESTTVNNVDDSSTSLYFGPKLSYDYVLGGGISVGGDGSILLGTGSNAPTVSHVMATLKIWI